MLPLIFGALGAIAVANELLHPDSKRDRQIEKYRDGKQSVEDTEKNIQRIYQDYYLSLDDSNPRHDEVNYSAEYKKQVAHYQKLSNLTGSEQHDLIRSNAVREYNRGRINQEQLDKAFDFARKIKENN